MACVVLYPVLLGAAFYMEKYLFAVSGYGVLHCNGCVLEKGGCLRSEALACGFRAYAGIRYSKPFGFRNYKRDYNRCVNFCCIYKI